MKLLSIIIPAYNVECSIKNCLDKIISILNDNYEIIVINDGSRDLTLDICNKYAKKYKHVKIVSINNVGAGAARNIGINISSGKYLMFCDADDSYDEVELNMLVNKLEKYMMKCDLLCFDYRNVWNGEVEAKENYYSNKIIFKDSNDKIDYISSKDAHIFSGYSVWNKVYKKSIIISNQIYFPERDMLGNKDDWAEDLVFNLQYYSCIKNILVINDPVYLLTKHGIKSEQNDNKCLNRIEHMSKLLLYFENSKAFINNINKCMWIIAIWHIKRYLYLDINNTKPKVVYNILSFNDRTVEWLKSSLKNWNMIKNRWSEKEALDYKYLIQYLINGNNFLYKLKNYYLWRIRR
ncbi:hypothetical protein B5E92_06680 [Erysipelatoclostridium sp. An15]|uniref:glycosyltransferase family 2 protein n=1 Tax=Erysipelatoclostridium sp. An15 TaxID=1965566 RepID=UPI000B3AACD5|nr:glycosyltransferase family 2 protein [Erysipelatoclostridium sp. An15]OUQ07665.1 hypothetical protein B5E92_06680 [Erysipelatoclostridium sp. An15]